MSEDIPVCLFSVIKYVTTYLFQSRSLYARGRRKVEHYHLVYNKAVSVLVYLNELKVVLGCDGMGIS